MTQEEMLGEVLRDAIARASHDRSDLTKAAEEAATAFKAGIAAFESTSRNASKAKQKDLARIASSKPRRQRPA